ncbi:MAG: hypothetical protein EBS96_14690, partial [Spartobacteria bacterium]|nr:hypothetical protein [Spartobacteria bacterium]
MPDTTTSFAARKANSKRPFCKMSSTSSRCLFASAFTAGGNSGNVGSLAPLAAGLNTRNASACPAAARGTGCNGLGSSKNAFFLGGGR